MFFRNAKEPETHSFGKYRQYNYTSHRTGVGDYHDSPLRCITNHIEITWCINATTGSCISIIAERDEIVNLWHKVSKDCAPGEKPTIPVGDLLSFIDFNGSVDSRLLYSPGNVTAWLKEMGLSRKDMAIEMGISSFTFEKWAFPYESKNRRRMPHDKWQKFLELALTERPINRKFALRD